MNQNIERFNPNINNGLTEKQIQERKKQNLINCDTSIPTKTIKRILFENFFTLFNFLNLFLALAIFSVGSYKNMLFLVIVIINTAISTIQEIHSKKVIDKLSILAESKATVIRNGQEQKISIHELVLDDILKLDTGNQVSTDSLLLDGELEVNESFITGEPNTITKKIGDTILSGSFIVSGHGIAKVDHIGEDNFTAKISMGAKYVKKVNSEIMTSLKKIIKILTFAIIPIGLLLFYNHIHLSDITYQEAVVKTVAAIIGMIPEGLVLLTSTVLAISVIKLSKYKVLVQELYCIETLARVDTLCLDKTGTLTEGSMEVKDFIPCNINKKEMNNILANIAKYSDDNNSTINAIRKKFTTTTKDFIPENKIAFSSQTKWSGIHFSNVGTYVIGAPEFVFKTLNTSIKDELQNYSKNYRVLVLAHSSQDFTEKSLPTDLSLIGYILILDKVRKEAKQTIKYFYNQGVDIKIISGDNPITVSKIAKQVGIKNCDNYIDMSTIKTDQEISNIVSEYSIFGRVSPMQKKSIIIALQNKGKTVAMTGDGVNDVLALKTSDCSIAMANGSDATKTVSQLILLDSNFASMPKVVAEGRKTINNIERSASLFLVKTIYSCLLSIMFLFMKESYPFIPIQLSLISVVTIGIPSFILALEPNTEKIKGHFLKNIISRSIPTGLVVTINIFIITILNKFNIITDYQISSLCVISTGVCGLILLFTLARSRKSEHSKLPFSVFRFTLSISMTCLFIIGLTIFNWLFNIVPLTPMFYSIISIIILSIINFIVLSFIMKKLLKL